MTAPLGGKRRERKRLVRCGHKDQTSWFDPETTDTLMKCYDCGATGTIDRMFAQTSKRPYLKLPDRIARKTADA